MESMDDDVKKFLISLAQLLKWIEQVKNLTINVQVKRDSKTVFESITETDYCVKG